MLDLYTTRHFIDLRQREIALRAQQRQRLIEARAAIDPTSPAFPRQDRSRIRVALSVIPAAARGAFKAGRTAATSGSY